MRRDVPDVLHFTVASNPEPAGSKRAFAVRRAGVLTGRVTVTDDNPKARSWKADVRDAAREAVGDDHRLLLGPLGLEVIFTRVRPASHFGTGRNAGVVKASAPRWPITKPDATKLLRGLEDALTSIVWRDDSQVVAQSVVKRYGPTPGAEVSIWQM